MKSELKRYTPLKPRSVPIRKVSREQYRRLNRYRNIKEKFLEDHPVCAIGIPGCTHISKYIHHGRGKIGELFFETEYFIPVCDGPCHRWAETHPHQAYELGLSFKRNG